MTQDLATLPRRLVHISKPGWLRTRWVQPSEGSNGGGQRRTNLGLRARVLAAFTAGTALVSFLLASSTYIAVRHTLIDQREELAARQTFVNARLVRSGLRTPRADVPRILESLENPTGSQSLIFYRNNWYSSNVSSTAIPESLRRTVSEGTPARMRFGVDDEGAQLAIGVPIPSIGASYFEVSELDELNATLSTLQLTLVIAGALTTLGGAALGIYASRRVLQPVTQAAFAAEAIAGGDMTTRLTRDGDPDLDRLVVSFNRMVDALQVRMARDARFASDVSHELRSPLMTLASGMSVLQSRRQELPPRSQTALDLLADEIERFQRMVQDLLEISRTDASHVDFALEEVMLGEFVERVVGFYERDIPVEMAPGLDDVVVSVDKRRMQRIVGNLIENADRYAGGATRVRLEAKGDLVQIIVDDAGPGVPEADRERIFERFARGTQSGSRASGEGTGLGLSLVEEHVRLHKGTVHVTTSPDGGARFVVEFPAEQ